MGRAYYCQSIHMTSQCMRFPTMWYVRPAKPQISLRICTVWSEPLLEYSMTVKLLTEHHLEFLCLKGGCTGSSESTHVKMRHCWKSHVTAHVKYIASLPGVTLTSITNHSKYLLSHPTPFGPRCKKICLPGDANTGADQPAHLRRLISTFVIRYLESIISKLASSEMSIF